MANIQMGGAFDPSRDVALGGSLSVTSTTSFPITAVDITATGATGTTAAVAPSVYPTFVNAVASGVSGAGINLPSGSCVPGAQYTFFNQMTGVLKIYSVGPTINGTTGTTAFSLTSTGNKMAVVQCTQAGAWLIAGNT